MRQAMSKERLRVVFSFTCFLVGQALIDEATNRDYRDACGVDQGIDC